MPKKSDSPIREAIGSVIAAQRVELLARELGVVKRQRKLCGGVRISV